MNTCPIGGSMSKHAGAGLSPTAMRPRKLLFALAIAIAMNGNAQTPNADTGCLALLAAATTVSMDQPKPTPVSTETQQSCEISFQDLQSASRTIVDIRESNGHAKLSVRGALNLPMSSLRHRQFLKTQAIVLVDEGKSPSSILRACGELKIQGFKDVRVLLGGLRTLHANGAPLDADAASIQRLYQLTPAEFDSEMGRPGWRTIDAGVDRSARTNSEFALHETLSTVPGAKSVSTQLHDMLQKHPGNTFVLISANDSFKRETMEALSPPEKARVLILAGGLDAFQRYQARQAGIVAQAGKALSRPCTEM